MIVGHWTCALESGPLIGAPAAPKLARISVVRVDGDTPRRECPREDRDGRPRAGVTRPAGVSVGGGGAGSLRGGGDATIPGCCWRSPSGCAYWGIPPGGAANPAGPVVAVISVGPCETLPQILHKNLDPLRAFGSGSCWSCWPAYCCWPCGPVQDAVLI